MRPENTARIIVAAGEGTGDIVQIAFGYTPFYEIIVAGKGYLDQLEANVELGGRMAAGTLRRA